MTLSNEVKGFSAAVLAAVFYGTNPLGTLALYADGEAYDEISKALVSYKEYVAAQTLALDITLKDAAEAVPEAVEAEWNEGTIRIAVKRS